MPDFNWTGGLSGLGSGAAGGAGLGMMLGPEAVPITAAIGAGLGGLAGLLNGSGGADEARDEQIQAWRDILNRLKNPSADEQAALGRLRMDAASGMNAEDRAANLEAAMEAAGLARSQAGAIRQSEDMRGHGVANSAQSAVLRDQANQAAANRYGLQTAIQAGQASARQRAANAALLAEDARRNQMMMAATQGLTHGLASSQDYDLGKQQAMSANLAGAFGSLAQLGMAFGRRPGGAPPVAPGAIEDLGSGLSAGKSFSSPLMADGESAGFNPGGYSVQKSASRGLFGDFDPLASTGGRRTMLPGGGAIGGAFEPGGLSRDEYEWGY